MRSTPQLNNDNQERRKHKPSGHYAPRNRGGDGDGLALVLGLGFMIASGTVAAVKYVHHTYDFKMKEVNANLEKVTRLELYGKIEQHAVALSQLYGYTKTSKYYNFAQAITYLRDRCLVDPILLDRLDNIRRERNDFFHPINLASEHLCEDPSKTKGATPTFCPKFGLNALERMLRILEKSIENKKLMIFANQNTDRMPQLLEDKAKSGFASKVKSSLRSAVYRLRVSPN